MKSLFTLMAIFFAIIVLLLGFTSYWQASDALKNQQQQTAKAVAEGIAANLSSQVNLLQNLVSKLAQSPGVVAAFSSHDASKIQQTAQQLAQYIPAAINIKLIPPLNQDNKGISDEAIGFADMELVRESFIASKPVAIHETGPKQHLAIAAKTVKDNAIIGVLLVSINPESISASIKNANLMNNYVRLMQGELQIVSRGDSSLSESSEQSIAVANTNWQIFYRETKNQGDKFIGIFIAIPLTGMLFILLGVQFFEKQLLKDRATILAAVKDLCQKQWQVHYATKFSETHFMITALADYNQKLNKAGAQGNTEALEYTDSATATETPQADDSQQSAVDLDPNPQKTNYPLSGFTGNNITKLIFQEFEVGGIVDKSLNKDILYALGKAFASELAASKITKITVAYDGRLSSQSYAESFAKGVIAAGVNVIDIGLASAPLHYFALLQAPGQSGAMITGSYLPINFNSLKLFLQGDPISPSALLAVKQRIDTDVYLSAPSGNIEKINRFANDYLNSIRSDIHILRPLKVVIDCGNGVTSLFAPQIFKNLGCEVIELFCEVNGNFPNHHPDPNKTENLSDVIAAVQYYEATIGIAFDGDGARLGVVDSQGKIISPDKLLLLFTRHILQTKAGASIIYDERCENAFKEEIIKLGGQAIAVKAESFLMHQAIKETAAMLAGNNEGNIYFKDRWPGFSDGLYVTARLLEILSVDTRNSSLIFNSLDHNK